MRILMMDNYLTVGGVATFLETLGSELADRGHTVHLLTAVDDHNTDIIHRFRKQGIQVHGFSRRKNNVLNAVRFLKQGRRIIKREHIDIVHSHHRVVNFTGILLSKLLALPHLITFHVIKDDHQLLHKLWKKEAVAVPSRASKKHLAEHYGLDEDKVRVIHNAIRPEFETDAARLQHLRQARFNEAGKWYVGYIGRLSQAKGVDVLLDSIPLVRAECPNVEFRVFGGGEERPRLERQCRALGLDPETLLCGATTHVNEVLSLLDLCVIPSRSESFCLFALECMRAGKPVIASAAGGIPEVVSHGHTGILTEPGDPALLADEICALYKNRSTANTLAENGRQRFQEHFSLDIFCRQYLAAYRDLIKAAARDKA